MSELSQNFSSLSTQEQAEKFLNMLSTDKRNIIVYLISRAGSSAESAEAAERLIKMLPDTEIKKSHQQALKKAVGNGDSKVLPNTTVNQPQEQEHEEAVPA